jgi:hypothetical protein
MSWEETPPEIPTRCPSCAPELEADTYVIAYCLSHSPSLDGIADQQASPIVGTDWISGSAEAGGDTNRAACAFFHRHREQELQP